MPADADGPDDSDGEALPVEPRLGDEREFEALLEHLRHSRGFDFRGYKRTTLMRRVGKRAQQVGCASWMDYLDYLELHGDEFPQLFNVILINVTEFLRDRNAWEFVESQIIPRITAGSGPVRVWSAGCATGEEAFTIAVLLCEAMGRGQFLERVKIYATDVDEDALAKARNGYSAKEVQPLGPELVTQYFERQGGRFSFRGDLRRAVIFGRHDLLQDAPISRLDLLICRNTMMYFMAESQARVLARFHYALKDEGFLFLGRAEMLLTHASLFTPVDLKHRVFRKVPQPLARQRIAALVVEPPVPADNEPRDDNLEKLAMEALPVAQLVIDGGGILVAANESARSALGVDTTDLGRRLRDLRVGRRPVDLGPAVDEALREGTVVELGPAEHHADGGVRNYDVRVVPLLRGHQVTGVSVTFTDVTVYNDLRRELEQSKHEIETAYEELQSSSEELETTNEELQSTVEELETTNEELQSSNEELETMNEELESTNTELQTINADLRQRTDDIDRLNALLESILSGVQGGVVAVDAGQKVVLWNARAEDLWGLRAEEAVDQDFFGLDIGLPLDRLRRAVRPVMEGGQKSAVVDLEATNRRGRTINCRITATPLPVSDGGPHGMILVMEEAPQA